MSALGFKIRNRPSIFRRDLFFAIQQCSVQIRNDQNAIKFPHFIPSLRFFSVIITQAAVYCKGYGSKKHRGHAKKAPLWEQSLLPHHATSGASNSNVATSKVMAEELIAFIKKLLG
jgi:hypothetical protein